MNLVFWDVAATSTSLNRSRWGSVGRSGGVPVDFSGKLSDF